MITIKSIIKFGCRAKNPPFSINQTVEIADSRGIGNISRVLSE